MRVKSFQLTFDIMSHKYKIIFMETHNVDIILHKRKRNLYREIIRESLQILQINVSRKGDLSRTAIRISSTVATARASHSSTWYITACFSEWFRRERLFPKSLRGDVQKKKTHSHTRTHRSCATHVDPRPLVYLPPQQGRKISTLIPAATPRDRFTCLIPRGTIL